MAQLFEFIGNHPFLVGAAFLLAVMVIANEVRLATRGSYSVTPDQTVRLMKGGAILLDLRSREEYETGHIASARHVPLDDLDSHADKLAKRLRNKPLIAYDANGTAASRAAAALRRKEFETVFSLRGGLAAWRAEHLPLEKGAGGRKGARRGG